MTENQATLDGARLRAIRVLRGLSQEQLADLAGVKQSTISKIENGTARNPRYESAVLLAKALDVRPEDLLQGAFPPPALNIYDPALPVFGKLIEGEKLTPEEEASARAWLERWHRPQP